MLKVNSFNSGSSSFVGPSNIPETSSATETPAETSAIKAPVETAATKPTTFLHSAAFSVALSNVEAHEGRYKYLNIALELFTIPAESIIITHRKIFIKIDNLAYFSRLKKHSKVGIMVLSC